MLYPGEANPYRGIRVAVLGGSGFIGRWVARTLCRRGATVCVAVRNKVNAETILSQYDVRAQILELDLSDSNQVRRLFQEVRPSITFNLAGYGVDPAERNPQIAHQINTDLVKTVCEAAAEAQDSRWPGQTVVQAGSAAEYGAPHSNLSEDCPPNPSTLYGRTKLSATECVAGCCEARQLRAITARLFTVYGPGEHPGRLLPSLLKVARTGEPLELSHGRQKRDFTYVEDVAEGLVRLGLAASARPGQTVNLATGEPVSVRCFVETAQRLLAISPARLKFGSIPPGEEEMEHFQVPVGNLRRLIGWVPPTDIAEGIRRTSRFTELDRTQWEHAVARCAVKNPR